LTAPALKRVIPAFEAIEIHQALKRSLEVLRVVEAGRLMRSARLQPGHHGARAEESCGTAGDREIGAHLVEEIAGVVAPGQITEGIA
jgi:hypothetical protein